MQEDALPILVSYVNRPTTDFSDEVAAGTALLRIASFPDLRVKLLSCDPNILDHMHQTGLWGFIEQTGNFQVPRELAAFVGDAGAEVAAMEEFGGEGVAEDAEDDALGDDFEGDNIGDDYDSADSDGYEEGNGARGVAALVAELNRLG